MRKALSNLLLLILGIGGGLVYLLHLCSDDACKTIQASISTSATQIAQDGSIYTTDGILLDLKNQGVLQERWTMDNPPIGLRGTTAIVEGEVVLLFEYSSDKTAQSDAQSMQKNSTTAAGTKIHWGENVHYFQQRSLVAIYIGSSRKVLTALTQSFGNEIL